MGIGYDSQLVVVLGKAESVVVVVEYAIINVRCHDLVDRASWMAERCGFVRVPPTFSSELESRYVWQDDDESYCRSGAI